MKKTLAIISIIIFISFLIGLYLYPSMPDQMASHWDINGKVDNHLPKFWGLFLMPLVSVGMVLLFILIPKIDPLKENIEKFMKYYNRFIIVLISYLFYIYSLTILWNIGYEFSMKNMIIPAFGFFFLYIGVMLENAKRNWFIGIRTPWTLSNETVWNKTHKLGAKLFKISGIITFLGLLFNDLALTFFLAPITISTAYLIVYSYFEYKKQTKKQL